MVRRCGFDHSAGLRVGDHEWPLYVAPVDQSRPCPDRDYDPTLFEVVFPMNYSAYLSIAFTSQLISC
jgi:hypothetical protein